VSIEGLPPVEAPDFDDIDKAVVSPAPEPRLPFSPRDLQ
jgi:hypothetical protein